VYAREAFKAALPKQAVSQARKARRLLRAGGLSSVIEEMIQWPG
jgi:hypothetical protein